MAVSLPGPLLMANCRLTKSRVDETGSKFKDGTTDGKIGAHLGHAQVARPDEADTPDEVSQQDGQRAGRGQDAADTDEETGTNGATDGHELDVAGRETTDSSTVLLVDVVSIEKDARGSVGDVGGLSALGLGVWNTHDG